MAEPSDASDILTRLAATIASRRDADPATSYVASLLRKGDDAILKKIGEEATEVVIAAKGGKREEIVYETSDLVFHLLVLLGYCDIPPEDIFAELRRRFGMSGIEEKNSRPA